VAQRDALRVHVFHQFPVWAYPFHALPFHVMLAHVFVAHRSSLLPPFLNSSTSAVTSNPTRSSPPHPTSAATRYTNHQVYTKSGIRTTPRVKAGGWQRHARHPPPRVPQATRSSLGVGGGPAQRQPSPWRAPGGLPGRKYNVVIPSR